MAAMEALANAYGEESDSDENKDGSEEIPADHTVHLNPPSSINDLKSKFKLNCAPLVTVKVCNGFTSAKKVHTFVDVFVLVGFEHIIFLILAIN